MQKTYKILSLLLEYPEKDVYDAIPFIYGEAINDHFLDEEEMNDLDAFLTICENQSLDEWQMYYVNLFDMSKQINLYVFDHIYGDSREKGQAMVNLKEMYSKGGYGMTTNELPDFLPVFLEYLSFLTDEGKTLKLLNDIQSIIEKLYKLTNEQDVYYKHLFNILYTLSNRTVSKMVT